jgi:hypothetical protein
MMTAIDSKPKALGFAISYGFVGGPAMSREFRTLLQSAGLQPAPLNQADIIIAHSAGCWLIPPDIRPHLVIYISLPLATTRWRQTWFHATSASFMRGRKLHNLNIRLKNIYYAILQPRRNFNVFRHIKTLQPVIFPGAQTVVIANRYDPWPQAPILADFIANKPWAFLSLAGTHDNLWEEPDIYAAIIEHYARLLA